MGAVAIWFGKYAKILASLGLVFKAGAKIINDTGDPSSVAVDAPKGSLYISTNGNVYRKTDDGSSTNWSAIVGNVAQVVRVGGAGADYPTIAAMHAAITDNGPAKQYVALLSPVVFAENVALKPFIALVGVGNGTNSPTIVGKIGATGFPAGGITTINRIGQAYTVASDGEVCNDWVSPVLANDCFFQFTTANNYAFTGIRQDCSGSPNNNVVAVLGFISAVSTYNGSTKDIVGYEAVGAGKGCALNQIEISIESKNASGNLIPRKVNVSGTAGFTTQGCLIRLNNVSPGSTVQACINNATNTTTGFRSSKGDQVRVTGDIATCDIYCCDTATEYEAVEVNINMGAGITGYITNTAVGGTQKVWLASTNKRLNKRGNGLSIVTPFDLVNTGFVEWSTVGVNYWTYVAATRTFTVEKRGAGLIKSAPVVWPGGQSVVLADFATNYVYVDDTGILRATTTANAALYENNIVLFEPWAQNLNSIVAKENHPVNFATAVSTAWHNLLGALLQSSDSLLAINGVATNREIAFQGPNTLTDHGLDSTIPATAQVSWRVMGRRASDGKMYQYGNLTQLLSQIDVSTTLTTVAAGAFVVGLAYEIKTPGNTNFTLIGAENNSVGTCFTATGVGSGTGDAYRLTSIPNAWVVLRLGVVKDSIQSSSPTFLAVFHNASFGTQTAARNAIAAGSIAAFPAEAKSLEIVRVGYAIINGNASGTGTMVTPVTDLEVFRSASGGGGSSTAGSLITLNPTNFDGQFTSTESNVQALADRADDYGYIPAWVATTATYRVGNVVKQYGSVYRCITAHTASAAFSTDIAKWEQVSIAKFATVAAAEAASGSDNELCYVVETETLYRFEASGSSYTDDNLWALSTAASDTRWLGVAGKYNLSRKLSEGGGAIAAGGSIDLSSAVGSERSYVVIGDAVGQNAMSSTPFTSTATPPAEPMTVWLIGLHNTYTVTLATNDAAQGALIAGGFIELGRGAAICLKYSPAMARWVEIARSSGTF